MVPGGLAQEHRGCSVIRWLSLRLVIIAMLVATGFGGAFTPHVVAQSGGLDGCGDVFSVASIGIEGRVQGASRSGTTLIVSVRIANVTDDEVMVPVGEGFGTWELAMSEGDRVPYEADRSFQLTRDGMGGDLGMAPEGQRTIKLVFSIDEADQLTLFNYELGGDLARDGAPVCEAAGPDSTDGSPSSDPTATPGPAQPRRTAPTAVPTDRPAPATATAMQPVRPTSTPRPATTTPAPRRPTATATPGLAQPRRNTPTPRRSTPTPAARGSSATALARALENSDWQYGEYFGDIPYTDQIDCENDSDAICVGAVNDVGGVVFLVFASAGDCRSYALANDLTESIFTSDYLGYDYYWAPSYLTDDGSSVAVALVGQVLVVSIAEDPGYTPSLYSDPDVNAIGLLMGGIQRADRLS